MRFVTPLIGSWIIQFLRIHFPEYLHAWTKDGQCSSSMPCSSQFASSPTTSRSTLRDLLQIQDEAVAFRFEIKDVFDFDHIFQLHSTTWGNNQAALASEISESSASLVFFPQPDQCFLCSIRFRKDCSKCLASSSSGGEWWMDAELGLVLTLYGGREEEANPQESRKAGFVCQETGRSYNQDLDRSSASHPEKINTAHRGGRVFVSTGGN